MNYIDGLCKKCGLPMRVLSGIPQVCKECQKESGEGIGSNQESEANKDAQCAENLGQNFYHDF